MYTLKVRKGSPNLKTKPPEPRFVPQNRTSNLLNRPKKTEPRTRFVPSLIPIMGFLPVKNLITIIWPFHHFICRFSKLCWQMVSPNWYWRPVYQMWWCKCRWSNMLQSWDKVWIYCWGSSSCLNRKMLQRNKEPFTRNFGLVQATISKDRTS